MESVDPQFIKFALLLLFGGISAGAGIAAIWRMLRPTPPLHEAYCTKAEAKAIADAASKSQESLSEQLTDLSKEVHEGFRRIDDVRRGSVANLHDKLERELAQMRRDSQERGETLNARVDDLSRRVDALPERVITMLKNARDLH